MKNPNALGFRELYESRLEPESARRLMSYYWYTLLILLAVTSVVSVSYGAWEFMRSEVQEPDLGVRPAPINLNKTELQKLLQALDKRVKHFDEVQAAPSLVKDPS